MHNALWVLGEHGLELQAYAQKAPGSQVSSGSFAYAMDRIKPQ